MKKAVSAICLVVALAFPTGCKTPTSTTPPAALAPGFTSPADQTMDQVLVGADKFYSDIQAKITAGTYTPSPTEATALSTLKKAIQGAETIYVAFHNGTATQAQAQSAVNSVTAQQTAIQSTLTTGVTP